jgi:hypothetical protein
MLKLLGNLVNTCIYENTEKIYFTAAIVLDQKIRIDVILCLSKGYDVEVFISNNTHPDVCVLYKSLKLVQI